MAMGNEINAVNKLVRYSDAGVYDGKAADAVRADPNESLDARTKVIRAYAKVGDMSSGLSHLENYADYTPLLREDKIFRIFSQTNSLTTTDRQESGVTTVRDVEFYCPHTKLLPSLSNALVQRKVFDIEVVVLGAFGDKLEIQTQINFTKGLVSEVIYLGQAFLFRYNPMTVKIEVSTRDRDGTLQGKTAFEYNTETGEGKM